MLVSSTAAAMVTSCVIVPMAYDSNNLVQYS